MIRPSKYHKLKPLGLFNYFPKNSRGCLKKLGKTEGVKLTSLLGSISRVKNNILALIETAIALILVYGGLQLE